MTDQKNRLMTIGTRVMVDRHGPSGLAGNIISFRAQTDYAKGLEYEVRTDDGFIGWYASECVRPFGDDGNESDDGESRVRFYGQAVIGSALRGNCSENKPKCSCSEHAKPIQSVEQPKDAVTNYPETVSGWIGWPPESPVFIPCNQSSEFEERHKQALDNATRHIESQLNQEWFCRKPKPTHRTVGVVEAVGWMLQHLEEPIMLRRFDGECREVLAKHSGSSELSNQRIVIASKGGAFEWTIEPFLLYGSRAGFLIPVEDHHERK